MTNIPQELIERIPSYNFEELYGIFDDLDPDKTIRRKIEEGINIHFDFNVIIEEYYKEFPDAGICRVQWYGEIDLFAFLKEKRDRMKVMRKYIYENYNQDVTEGRIKNE